MKTKDIIRADSETFWKWIKANPIQRDIKPAYVAADKVKSKRVGTGKSRKGQG